MSCDKREANNTPAGELLDRGEDDSKGKKTGGLRRSTGRGGISWPNNVLSSKGVLGGKSYEQPHFGEADERVRGCCRYSCRDRSQEQGECLASIGATVLGWRLFYLL